MIPTTLSDFVLAVEESGPVSPANANWGQLALIFVATTAIMAFLTLRMAAIWFGDYAGR